MVVTVSSSFHPKEEPDKPLSTGWLVFIVNAFLFGWIALALIVFLTVKKRAWWWGEMRETKEFVGTLVTLLLLKGNTTQEEISLIQELRRQGKSLPEIQGAWLARQAVQDQSAPPADGSGS